MSSGFGKYLKEYLEYNNISQSEFATRLGITQKHMNEILNGKTDITLEMAVSIEQLTSIPISFIIKSEHRRKVTEELLREYKDEKTLNKKLKEEFSLKELLDREWVSFKDITNPIQNYMDIVEYLGVKDLYALSKVQEKTLFKKTGTDLNKLNLWIARADKLSKDQKVGEYDSSNFCFMINGKDSFYFELFHELGHCKSDYNEAKSKIIIEGNDKQEERADNFALKTMIPENIWISILEDYSEERLIEISKKDRIPMCFIVGRLAKVEKIKYSDEMYKKYCAIN